MKFIRLLLLANLLMLSFPFLAHSQQIEKHSIYIFQTENGPNTYSSTEKVVNVNEIGDSTLIKIQRKDISGDYSVDSLVQHENKIFYKNKVHYDYNLEKGDTFWIREKTIEDSNIFYIVKAVDTIVGNNGEKIKRWQLKHEYDWLTWHKNYGEANQGWFYLPLYNALIGTSTVLAICKQDSLVYWRESVLYAATPSCDFDYLDTYLGIEPNTNKKQVIEFFPNPSRGFLTFNNDLFGLEYQIIDMNGKVKTSGTIRREIDIQDIAPGVYILQIQEDKYFSYDRLIIK